MARRVAPIVLITELQPLMPHAHGIISLAYRLRLERASGKGIPMQRARGDISRLPTSILTPKGNPAVDDRIVPIKSR
jgi:hypothetical protein